MVLFKIPQPYYLKTPKAKIAYKLSQTFYYDFYLFFLWFIIGGLNYNHLSNLLWLENLIGWLIPICFGISFISSGIWGLYTGILPNHTSGGKWGYGWIPNYYSKIHGVFYLYIGLLFIIGTILKAYIH